MNNLLLILSGLFWLLTYSLIIRQGFKDKSYGMPIPALLGNFSWEFIYSFVYGPTNIQLYINIAWLSFDAVIFFQLLKYWSNEIKDISSKLFYIIITISLVTTYLLLIYMEKEFHSGGFYSVYGINFMMSILFILMLYRRKSLRGQSIYIAIFKLLGTLAASLAAYKYQAFMHNTPLLEFLYVSTFLLDLIYVVLVYIQANKPSLLSWNQTI